MPQPPDKVPNFPRVEDEGWLIGKLLAHGKALYTGAAGKPVPPTPSYFIQLRTLETEEGANRRQREADEGSRPIDGRDTQRTDTRQDGGVVRRWGTDLQRAITDSKSGVNIGHVVGIKVTGREPMYDSESRIIPGRYKNLWEVETVQYINRRNIIARKMNEDFREARRQGGSDPVLRALYLIHTGVERLAPLWFPNPEDQRRFIEKLHGVLDRPSREREALIARLAKQLADQQKAQGTTQKPSTRQPETPTPTRQREALVRE